MARVSLSVARVFTSHLLIIIGQIRFLHTKNYGYADIIDAHKKSRSVRARRLANMP